MRRLIAPLTLLLAILSGATYFGWGVYVRGQADRILKQSARSLSKENPAQARDELQWLLWFEPQHPAALHLMGLSYLKQNDLSAAIEHLQRVPEGSVVSEQSHLLLGSALLAEKRLEQAHQVLSRHLSRYPKSIVACRQLSGLLLTELRGRDAIDVLEAYLRVTASDRLSSPDCLLMLRDLATAEFHPPPPEACLMTLQKSLEQHRDQPRVELALARCHLRLGDREKAEPILRKALTRNPQDRQARFLLCELRLEQDDPAQAESALLGYENSESSAAGNLTKFEQDDRFWELRCRIAEARQDTEQALEAISRAITIRPSKDYEARRARLLQRARRVEEARQAFERSHELAKAELELWRLSRDLGTRDPNPSECEQVAKLYQSLEKYLSARLWRQLGRQIALETPPE